MPTPLFTSATGKVAAQKSVDARKDNRKTTRWLAKLGLKETETKKIIELLQTTLATPGGTFIAGWLFIDLLDRVGYFHKYPNQTTVASQGANPNVSGTPNSIQSFINSLGSSVGLGAGGGVAVLLNSLFSQGGVTGGGAVLQQMSTSGSSDAALLKAGLFAICMTQALGGGQGMSALITPLLTAIK